MVELCIFIFVRVSSDIPYSIIGHTDPNVNLKKKWISNDDNEDLPFLMVYFSTKYACGCLSNLISMYRFASGQLINCKCGQKMSKLQTADKPMTSVSIESSI